MKSLLRIFCTCVLLLIFVAASIHLSSPTRANTNAPGTWSPSQIISASDKAGVYPEINVDAAGTIHVVYEETPDLKARVLRYTNNQAGSFTPGIVISGDLSDIERSAITSRVVNGQQQVHVVFAGRIYGQNNSFSRLYHSFSLDGGNTWQGPVRIIDDIAAYQADIAIDELGILHVAFNAPTALPNLDILAVFYINNKSGSWSAPEKIGDRVPGESYNGFPSIITNYVDNVVTTHVFFMGQHPRADQLGKWVFSTRKVGDGPWEPIQVRGTRSANFPEIVSYANNVYAIWDGLVPGSDTNIDVFYSVSADIGANWSTPQIVGGSPANGLRASLGRALDGSLMVVWDDKFNAVGGNEDIWSNYSPDAINWQGNVPVFQGAGFSLEVEVAGSCQYFHTVWHDSNINDTFKIFFSQTGPATNCVPPPTPTPVTPPTPTPPPVEPVTFSLNRTNSSPSKEAMISAQLTNVSGTPDQIRWSMKGFEPNDTTIEWQPFTTDISTTFPTTNDRCGYSLQVQARNSQTNEFSAVQSLPTVVDVGVQAGVSLATVENSAERPDATRERLNVVQPYAPAAGNAVFTRFSFIYYGISQEPSPCVGIESHVVEGYTPTSNSYPVDGFVPIRSFNTTSDNNAGVGFNEQTVQPSVVVTDTLANVRTYTRMLHYDDDPPVLAAGGSISVAEGSTPAFAIVSIAFNAQVTDDSYSDYLGLPNAGYWGAWIVASNSATPPTPAQFEQYGAIRQLSPGANTIRFIPLVNQLNSQMNQPGARYVHVRFIDGAGNYTETVLSTPEITLTRIQFPTTMLPVIQK